MGWQNRGTERQNLNFGREAHHRCRQMSLNTKNNKMWNQKEYKWNQHMLDSSLLMLHKNATKFKMVENGIYL